ncbi:MAG: SgcJ/EcaC family oxidoreductase [Lysobacterales bacterium]
MTRRLALIALLLLTPLTFASTPSDRLAIDAALDRWLLAWQEHNPQLAAQDYSEDADWTNAFGATRRGRTEIQAMLTEVFAMDFVMAGDTTYLPPEVRFVSDSLALVRTTARRKGQKTSSGDQLGERQTTHLRVFQKGVQGWKIISHLISDARSTERPSH